MDGFSLVIKMGDAQKLADVGVLSRPSGCGGQGGLLRPSRARPSPSKKILQLFREGLQRNLVSVKRTEQTCPKLSALTWNIISSSC